MGLYRININRSRLTEISGFASDDVITFVAERLKDWEGWRLEHLPLFHEGLCYVGDSDESGIWIWAPWATASWRCHWSGLSLHLHLTQSTWDALHIFYEEKMMDAAYQRAGEALSRGQKSWPPNNTRAILKQLKESKWGDAVELLQESC